MAHELSDNIKFVLKDDDVVWPTTMDGDFRIVIQKEGHNILGKGEHPVSEQEMISGVLNDNFPSRWRSKTNDKRKTPTHFSLTSPLVIEVHGNVGGVWVRHK